MAPATPKARQIARRVDGGPRSLGLPKCLAETFHDGVFGIVYFEPLAQRLIGCADARWLVDADLLGDGEVQ